MTIGQPGLNPGHPIMEHPTPMTAVRELVAGARKWAHRLRASGDYGPHVAELLDGLADALAANGHDIELVGPGELSYCRRCHGGEIDLEVSCAERLAVALDAARKETGR